MNNIESIISLVKLDLSKYSDAGLIDTNLLYNDAIRALKRFGNDILELQEVVLDVKAGSTTLPPNFFSLLFAYLCEPAYYKTHDVEFHDIQSSLLYKERVELGNSWTDCESCCEEKTENLIKENVYFKRGRAEFYYHRPQLLRLAKGFSKSACADKCRNNFSVPTQNEINIIRDTLYTNFNKGSIYMQYYGLPLDEEGRLNVADTKNGHLETYLEYFLKRRAAERLLGNNDAQGIQNLYQIYKQEEGIALRNASSEVKLAKLTPHAMKRWHKLNRLEALTFEIVRPVWL